MTIEEQLERLTAVVSALPAPVVAHDNQIDGLITVAEKLSGQMAAIERLWEAYLNTLPRQ
jgi:hypothetical protein